MNILLIFFALPIAVVIFSIILQKCFRCPIIVAAIIFAIFLVVTFVVNNLNFLVATIAYTLLAFIVAYIVMLLCRINWNYNNCCRDNFCRCTNRRRNECCMINRNTDSLDVSNVSLVNMDNETNFFNTTGTNNVTNDISIANNSNVINNNATNRNSFNGTYNIGRNGTTCTCNQVDNNTIAVRANICPNPNTNGRSGRFCGTYR